MEQQKHYCTLSDEELFDLSRQRPEAFDEIYKRYYPLLLRVAHKSLRSIQAAEDAVQDVLASLFHRRENIAFRVSLRSYLNKAIRFKILNIVRAEIVRSNYHKNAFVYGECKNVFAHLEAKELAQRIDKVFYLLPTKCRDAFVLSRASDYSQKDISRIMSISQSTVEKHIGKALKIFRSELPDYACMFSVS